MSKVDDQARGWRELLAAGRPGEALQLQLQEANPDLEVSRALEGLGDVRAHLRAKRWTRAKRVVETLGFRSGLIDKPRLLEELSQLEASGKLLERGQPEEALRTLEHVTLPLLEAEAETQRGTAYIFLAQNSSAEGAFARALELDPKHYRALTNRGNLALEEGRVDEAIVAYESALRINDSFSNAHHNLGVAYRRKGQVSRSVQAIRRAQRVSRQGDREEARSSVRELSKGSTGRFLKWVLYALVAVGLFLLLRAQGVV